MFKSLFHSTALINARFPALETRISRSSYEKNLKRISRLKAKLGPNYAIIGRDKRQSPLTERRSPSKPSQPPKPVPKLLKIEPLLLTKDKVPIPIIPGDWKSSIKHAPKLDEEQIVLKQSSIRKLVPEKVVETVELQKLELPEKVVPEKVMIGPMEGQTVSGPYYNYGLLPTECSQVFNNQQTLFNDNATTNQQELTRRILSVSNSSQKQIRKFNTKRMVELFQRYPGDCGSSEVQGIFINSCSNECKD